MPHLIELQNLTIQPNDGPPILKEITLKIERGEFLAIIGRPHSGKTTLLRSIPGFVEPTAGNVFLLGERLTGVREGEKRVFRRKMAFVFQNFNLVKRHSVLNNVLLGALGRVSTWRAVTGLFKSVEVHRAQSLLKMLHLDQIAEIRVDRLEDGFQQRTALARAFMQDGEIILADEPVAHLDPEGCHTVMEHLKKLQVENNKTIICSLGFLSLVKEYATRVIGLKEGQIIFDGKPQDLDDGLIRKLFGQGSTETYGL